MEQPRTNHQPELEADSTGTTPLDDSNTTTEPPGQPSEPGDNGYTKPLDRSVEIVFLRPDSFKIWQGWPQTGIMRQFLDRIKAFCIKYETDNVPDAFIDQLLQLYSKFDDRLFAIGYMKDGKMVGHMLAFLEHQTGIDFVMIFQAEADYPFGGSELVMNALKVWGKAKGASYIAMLTTRPEGMFKKFGFKVHRYFMKLPLEGENGRRG